MSVSRIGGAFRGLWLRSRRPSRAHVRQLNFDSLDPRIAPATFLVVNALDGPGTGPAGSLRAAITEANGSGDAKNQIVITPAVKRPIALTAGELSMSTSMTLWNRSGGPVEIEQTTPGERVFDIASSASASSVTIAGASRREAITLSGGNVSAGNGGGILVESSTTALTLQYVRLVGNSAGVASAPSTSQNGGAIYTSGRVLLIRTEVGTASAPNQASGDGGGIWAGAGVVMNGASIDGNMAGNNGGGLYVANGGTTLSNSRVNGNRALNVGGIYEYQGDVRVVQGSAVNGNSSTATLNVAQGNFGGGGIYAGIGNVFVSRSQVSDNHSVGMYSSGIVVGLGSVTVTAGSRVNGNSADGPGGGIAANFGGIVTVSGRSQVNRNTGAGIGGGIVNFAGPNGGVRILGGSQVNDNTLTNSESLGQAVGVFLQVLKDAASETGTVEADTRAAALALTSIEQALAGTAIPVGSLVAGGGIGTLLGAPITITGGSRVEGNLSGAGRSAGNPGPVGIGGAIFAAQGSMTITASTIKRNGGNSGGGGIWNGGLLTVDASTISENVATSSLGGGLFNTAGAVAAFRRSVLRANQSSSGGGAYNQGTLSLVGSAVVQNRAAVIGGGISNTGRLTLVRTVVSANSPNNITSTR